MNNTLCLGIFAALVYLRDLKWYYSAGQSLSGGLKCSILTKKSTSTRQVTRIKKIIKQEIPRYTAPISQNY